MAEILLKMVALETFIWPSLLKLRVNVHFFVMMNLSSSLLLTTALIMVVTLLVSTATSGSTSVPYDATAKVKSIDPWAVNVRAFASFALSTRIPDSLIGMPSHPKKAFGSFFVL